MASFTPLGCSVRLRVTVGTAVDGTPKLGFLTISKVDPTATPDAIDTAAKALGLLLAPSIVEVHRSSNDLVL